MVSLYIRMYIQGIVTKYFIIVWFLALAVLSVATDFGKHLLILISYLWDSLQTWFEVSLTWFITKRVPAKADIHCSLTLEYSAFDLHKERAEWFLLSVIGQFITAQYPITVSYFTAWFDDTMAVAFRHTLIFHYAKFGYHSLHKDTASYPKFLQP